MLGIDYVSSEEEDVSPVTEPELPKSSPPTAASVSKPALVPAPTPNDDGPTPTALPEGPSQGPSTIPRTGEEELTNNAQPGSPYTSNRLMIQNLTLPTVPNLNVPPSPPGSPPRRSTQKFAQFLELKKKGQHFNQRLENSSVVRDPNHLSKLMDFASITNEDQYASTLPESLSVPVTWPKWAYGEALNASQKQITKAKENERSKMPRGSVDFVPARSGPSGEIGMPMGKGLRQDEAERAIARSDGRPREKR